MKKILLLVLLIGLASAAFSQEILPEKEFNFSIQTNAALMPMQLLLNGIYGLTYGNMTDVYSWFINVEFQFAINNYFTFSIMPIIGFTGTLWYEDIHGDTYFYDTFNYSLTHGLQYHFFGTRLKGWYAGIDYSIGVNHMKTDVIDNLLNVGFMGKGGYQWIWSNGFTLSFWFGLGNNWLIPLADNKYEYEKPNFLNLPINIGGNLSLGYSF
jgi:hypothetical protein